MGPRHLRQKFYKDLCSTVRIDSVHKTVNRGTKVGSTWQPSGVRDRREVTFIIGHDQGRINAVSRGGRIGRVQWRRVGGHTHSDEHDEQVDPDSKICKEAELLKCTDLAKQESDDGPKDYTNGIAKPESACLLQGFAVTDKNNGNV